MHDREGCDERQELESAGNDRRFKVASWSEALWYSMSEVESNSRQVRTGPALPARIVERVAETVPSSRLLVSWTDSGTPGLRQSDDTRLGKTPAP